MWSRLLRGPVEAKDASVPGCDLFLLSYRFDGRVVAKLPFIPLSYIQGVSHRNLLGEDYTDCSFIFLYILCTMSIRQVSILLCLACLEQGKHISEKSPLLLSSFSHMIFAYLCFLCLPSLLCFRFKAAVDLDHKSSHCPEQWKTLIRDLQQGSGTEWAEESSILYFV